MKPESRSPDDHLSDSTLHVLERARAGDELAARTLLERALPAVRRWAHGRLPRFARNDADTQDVIQNVFLRVLRRVKRVQYRTVGELQAYLRRAVVNQVRDLIRASVRHGTSPLPEAELRDWKPSPLEAAIVRQHLDLFLEALGRLKPSDRQVIIWRIELGYTAEEIATRLGKSKAAAGMSVTRALTRLAKEMQLDISPTD